MIFFVIGYLKEINLVHFGVIILSYRMVGNLNNYDYLFKYIVVGDSNVGKSCLILRYTENNFKNEHEPTLGVQFASALVEHQELIIKTQIWDTAGQEAFKSITRSYYKGSIATLLIFDVTCQLSFNNLHKWLCQIKNYTHDRVEIVLLGNKIDLKAQREVSFFQAAAFAKEHGFQYFQVSALTGEGVQEAFLFITETIIKKIKNKELNTEGQKSLGVKKGKRQKKEAITRISSGFQNQSSLDKKSNCCN